MNEFRHEFSASSSLTNHSPTDSGWLSIWQLLRFSPHPSTQDPWPFFSSSLFPSCSETVRAAISTTTSTKFSRSEIVRTAFLTQQGIGALSITSTSAKLRTWKLELFEYNGGQCIGTAFQGEMSNADRHGLSSSYTDRKYARTLPNPRWSEMQMFSRLKMSARRKKSVLHLPTKMWPRRDVKHWPASSYTD